MAEGTRKTVFRIVIALMAGALACSLLGIAGVLLPLTLFAAAGFVGLSVSLVLKLGSLDGPGTDQAFDRGLADLAGRCYELAIRVSYGQRRSRHAIRDALRRTENVLGSCRRLRTRVGQLGRFRAGAAGAPGSMVPTGDVTFVGTGPEDRLRPVGPMLKEVMASVREMAVVLREVDHNAKDLITSTEETAYSMSRLDSFLQDMANRGSELESSTDSANRVALEGTKVVEEMGRENEAIISTVNEAASAVEDLGRWSQEVGKIVEVIRDIADETNLLALNASIIAAQSGEHGKAFGVVAEEIRGLAERTSSSTKEISDLVKAVQKNVANVVNGMKKSLQRVERGELLTRNAGTVLEKVFESFESSRSLAKQIASSTFEHKIDSSQVVRSLHKVTDIARRLQSHNSAGWTGAGETLGMARAVNALCGGMESAQGRSESIEDGGRRDSGEPKPCEGTGSGSGRVLAELVQEIDEWLESLEGTRRLLATLLEYLEQSADAATAGLLEASTHEELSGVSACWDIAACDVELREGCPAYNEDNRRVFFSRDAACMGSGTRPDRRVRRHRSSGGGPGEADHLTHKVGSGR